ncbi:MAG: Acetyltransferase family protein [Gemmatimonadetes bacterium]|nr:Acetyltransferase family protein [Gemmatimonadota bacterium]
MTVAERDGTIVGVVQPLDDEVNGLWVDPTAQRTGVGPVLLRSAERQITAAGYCRAWITCSGFNPGALRFYLREGYRETRRLNKEIASGLLDELIILERSFDN